MMEVKQNTAVDLNDLLAPVKSTDGCNDEVDDVVMSDLTAGARDLIKSNEKSNNGLIANGDETLSSLIDLDATAASLDLDSNPSALGAPVVSTELEDALLAEDDILPKLTDAKVNLPPSSVAVDDILADKVETSNSTTSSNNVRDPGDDLDTLLSKINDIVEDCLDSDVAAPVVEEKEEVVEANIVPESSDAANDAKAVSFDDSVILLDDTAIEESNMENDKTHREDVASEDEQIENNEETEKLEVEEREKKLQIESSEADTVVEGNKLNCDKSKLSESSEITAKKTDSTAQVDPMLTTDTETDSVATDVVSTRTVTKETPETNSEDDFTENSRTTSIICEKQIEENSKPLGQDIVDEGKNKTAELEPKSAGVESMNIKKDTSLHEKEVKNDKSGSTADDKETRTDAQEPTAIKNDSNTKQDNVEEKIDNEDSDDEIVFYVDKPPETENTKSTDDSETTCTATEKPTAEETSRDEKSKSVDEDDVVILDDDEEMETDKKATEPSGSQTEKELSKIDNVTKEPATEKIEEKPSTAAVTTEEAKANEDKKHSSIDMDNSDNARDDFDVSEKSATEGNKQQQETEETNSNCSSSSNLLLEAKQSDNTGDEPAQEENENENENEEEDDDGDVELIESESKEAEISSEKGEESSENLPPAKRPRLSADSEVSSKTDENNTCQKTSESIERKTDILTESSSTSTNTTTSLKRTHDVIELEIDDDKSNDSKTSSIDNMNKKAKTEEEIKPKEDNKKMISFEEQKTDSKVEDDSKEAVKKEGIKMIPSDIPIPLYPPPKLKTLCSEDSFSLDFLKKFRKSFDKMTKQDLEELVLQKVVEAIIHRSEFAEMRELIEKQEKLITSHRTKISELSKQFRDLEMVHNRVVKDIDQRNSQFIMPVKITRAVGLQVYIPNKKAVLEPSTASSNTPNVPASSPQRAVTATTQNNLTSPQRQYHHSSQLGDAQVRVGANTSSNTITSGSGNPPGPRRGCAQKITPIRPVPGGNTMTPNSQSPSSANTQVYRNSLNQNQISSQSRILNKNASAATVGASSSTNASPMQRQRYGQQSSQEGTPQQRIPSQQHQQQIIRSSANTVNSQRVVTQQKLPTNSASVQRRPEPTASSGSNSSASLDSYMNTLSQLTGGNTAVSITPAKPKEKAVIDLTDEDETPTAPSAISGQQTNSVSGNPGQRRSLPTQSSNTNSSLQQYGRTAPPLSRIPPSSQMANNNKNRQIGIQGQKNNSGFASTISTPAGTSITRINVAANTQGPQRVKYSHPAPLPATPPQAFNPSWKLPPPRPTIRINNLDNGIVISWTMEESMDRHAECVSYQIYAYQETSGPPTGDSWRHVGDVKAMLLPMAVTLTQFQEGQRYYFAVRAVDCHQRYGPFSLPKTWS